MALCCIARCCKHNCGISQGENIVVKLHSKSSSSVFQNEPVNSCNDITNSLIIIICSISCRKQLSISTRFNIAKAVAEFSHVFSTLVWLTLHKMSCCFYTTHKTGPTNLSRPLDNETTYVKLWQGVDSVLVWLIYRHRQGDTNTLAQQRLGEGTKSINTSSISIRCRHLVGSAMTQRHDPCVTPIWYW